MWVYHVNGVSGPSATVGAGGLLGDKWWKQRVGVRMLRVELGPPRAALGGSSKLFGVLHVSWEVTKNRFNRTCEVKSALCSHHRFSEEFKQQVVSGGR